MTDAGELLEIVVDHLCEHQAEEVAELSDQEIERRAKIGISRAQGLGFQKEANIVAYVSLLFVAGPHFDEQPNIREALTDPVLAPDTRIARLFELTQEADWDQAATLPQNWD